MNVEVKCEMIAKEIRTNYDSKNQMIMEENKKSRGSRIRNWIIMIAFTLGLILFFNYYLLLPKIQLGRAMLAASLTMFVIMTDFLFLIALQDLFFEKKKYIEYGIKIKIEEIEFFNNLKNLNVLDIIFLKYKKEVDLEIVYEEKDKTVSRKIMRGFQKIEDLDAEKFILDLDNRTITVPYEIEED